MLVGFKIMTMKDHVILIDLTRGLKMNKGEGRFCIGVFIFLIVAIAILALTVEPRQFSFVIWVLEFGVIAGWFLGAMTFRK